jgi:gliding motility-associated-like protein
MMPGNVVTTGTGTTKIVTGIASGVYNFTVTNASGCTSQPSASFLINIVTGPPVVIITNPAPVCFPATVDITVPAVTLGSTLNLIYTYWTDEAATKPYNTPGASPAGTYYIKGTTSDGFFTVKPVAVSVYRVPVAIAGPDQNLPNVFTAKLNAVLGFDYESGIWSLISGTGSFADSTDSKTNVTNLSPGRNKFRWTVTNKVCLASTDSVFINVGEIAVPTLITPNMDGKNDYLLLKKGDTLDKIDLVIFDRRGAEVYKNSDYDNTWNGVDYNGKQLPDDTYFYVVKSQSGTSISGFIVIRR